MSVSSGKTRSDGMFAVAGIDRLLAVLRTSVGCSCRAMDGGADAADLAASAEEFVDRVSTTRAWFVALISPSETPTAILRCLVASPTTRVTEVETRPRRRRGR